MIKSSLRPALLIIATTSLATPAMAGPRSGLPLDPELLPPNSAPGDCVVRRVTGPGGAYRWERIECAGYRSGSSDDRWGYGHNRLEVETRDRHAHGGRREDRYGPGSSQVGYGHGGAAGRDRDGYLVWPGKLP